MNAIFHCSLSIIKKNIKMYIVLIIQIVIISLVFIGLVGKLQFINYSKSIANTFNSCDAYYFSPYMFIDQDSCDVKNILFNELNEEVQIGKIYNLSFNYNDNILYAYGYNDTILDFANINMKTGKWFDREYNYEYLPVVGIGDEYSTGTIIELENSENDIVQKVQIIGTIDSKEYIIKFNKNGSESVASIGYFVSPPAENYKFIFPYDCENFLSLNSLIPTKSTVFENQIIILPEKIDDETIKTVLKSYGTSTNVQQMSENYKRDNKEHFITNGIVFCVFLLISIVSIGGTNGIQNILNQKRYIIYYILGLTKFKCAIIEAMRSFFIIIFSFMITILLYAMTPLGMIYSADEFKINSITFIYILLFILILYCITSLVYVVKLGNKDLIQLYKKILNGEI